MSAEALSNQARLSETCNSSCSQYARHHQQRSLAHRLPLNYVGSNEPEFQAATLRMMSRSWDVTAAVPRRTVTCVLHVRGVCGKLHVNCIYVKPALPGPFRTRAGQSAAQMLFMLVSGTSTMFEVWRSVSIGEQRQGTLTVQGALLRCLNNVGKT